MTRFGKLGAVIALALALMAGGILGPIISQPAQAQVNSAGYREGVMLSSTALTASGTTTAVHGFGRFSLANFLLTCPTVTGTSPSLTVTIEGSIDGGASWYTLVSMTAITAAGNTTKVWSDVRGTTAQFLPDTLRGNYVITGTTPSLTCALEVAAKS